MVLVVGACGGAGRALVANLVSKGVPVRASSRDPDKLAGSIGTDAEVVRLDVRDHRTFEPALRDVDTVVSSVHGLSPEWGNSPEVVESGVRALVDAAAERGVDRFVYHSLAGAAQDAAFRFGRVKHSTETHLARSGLRFTIVRPGAFMEFHALKLIGEPLAAGKPGTFIGPGTTALPWVSVTDLAELTSGIVEGRGDHSERIRLACSERWSRVEVLEFMENALGRKATSRHLPLGLVRMLHGPIRLLNGSVADLLEFGAAEDVIQGGVVPQPAEIVETGVGSGDSGFSAVAAPTTLTQVCLRWAETVSASA